MKKVHIINHTHWDREWYFSTMDSLVLSDPIFNEILDELKENKEAYFTLDGQISIVNEFLQLYPNRKADIMELANTGQLLLGPWYTQSDAQLVNGESIIRNLIIGIYETKKLANPMMVGYLPDTFGFHAQMPTILQNCGIDNFVFWRGMDYHKIKSPYFIWKGLADKQVYAINLMNGYGSIPRLYNDEVFLESKVFAQEQKIRSKTELDEVLIPIGNDQNKITCEINKKLMFINEKQENTYISSNYEDFVSYLKKQQKTLSVYEGEMRCPSVGRIHKTIGSIRMDIKLANYTLEQILLKRIEPLLVMASALHIQVSKELLFMAWKKVNEGQAHDGLAGCISDSVASDVLYRYKQAREICEGIENLVKKRISDALSLNDNQLLIFHLEPNTFYGYKKIVVLSKSKQITIQESEQCVICNVKEIAGRKNILVEGKNENYYVDEEPYYEITLLAKLSLLPFSYQVLHIVEQKMSIQEKNQSLSIENAIYKIYVENENVVLQCGDRKIENILHFEDCGNDGDTYDFSPLRGDNTIEFRVFEGSTLKNDAAQTLQLSGCVMLPKDLDERKKHICSTALQVDLNITLHEGKQHPNCEVIVHNTVKSHRLRIGITTDVVTENAIAAIPFGYLTRKVGFDSSQQWENEYLECPIDIEVMDDCVSVVDQKGAVSIFTKGIKEYQVIQNKIYITLFSTTGQLGKSDLVYRPGRASGDTTKQGHVMIETPQAQLLDTMKFSFKIALFETFDEARVAQINEAYKQQDVYYQSQCFNKFIDRIDNKIQSVNLTEQINEVFSLFALEGLLVSSIMPSIYEDDAFIVRIKNPTKEVIPLSLAPLHNQFSIMCVNALEEEQVMVNEIKKYDFIQLKFYLHKKES